MSANKSTAGDSSFDEERRYFLNPESVSVHLFCSICQEVFNDPQRAPCGHSYCRKCIIQWLKQSNTCPEDRRPLTQSSLHHDFILENIIGDQMVACPYRRIGCTNIGPLSMARTHRRDCSFSPSNLPEFLRIKNNSALDDKKKTASVEDDSIISESDGEDDVVCPTQLSLKMRLFQAGGTKRDLLCAAFDSKSSSSSSSSSLSGEKIKRLRQLLDD